MAARYACKKCKKHFVDTQGVTGFAVCVFPGSNEYWCKRCSDGQLASCVTDDHLAMAFHPGAQTLVAMNSTKRFGQDSSPQEKAEPAPKEEQPIEYTIRFAFLMDGEPNHRHMTITFPGAISTHAEMLRLENKLSEIATAIKEEDRKDFIVVTEHALFGKDGTIPVSRVDVKNLRISIMLQRLHDDFGVAEPGFAEKLDVPNYHISGVQLPIGMRLKPNFLDINRLGPFDPLVRFPLE